MFVILASEANFEKNLKSFFDILKDWAGPYKITRDLADELLEMLFKMALLDYLRVFSMVSYDQDLIRVSKDIPKKVEKVSKGFVKEIIGNSLDAKSRFSVQLL